MRSRPTMYSQRLPSKPNENWFNDTVKMWCGDHLGWNELSVVVDCYGPELLGWRLLPKGDSYTSQTALQYSLAMRVGKCLDALDRLTVESRKCAIFSSQHYKEPLESLGIVHVVTTPQPNEPIDSYIKSVAQTFSQTIQKYGRPTSLEDIRQVLRRSSWASPKLDC